MALVRANVAFDYAGRQVRVGEVFEDTNHLYVMFPSRFTVDTTLTAAGTTAATLGTVIKKVQVFDSAGSSLGFVPVYDTIT